MSEKLKRITIELEGDEATAGRYTYRHDGNAWRVTEMQGRAFSGDMTYEPAFVLWHIAGYLRDTERNS